MPSQNPKTLAKAVLAASLAMAAIIPSSGASKGTKAAMVGLNFADAAVDYTIEEKTKYSFTHCIFSFYFGTADNCILVVLPKEDKSEEETNKQE